MLRFQVSESKFFSQLEVSVFHENRTTELLGQCEVDIADLFQPGGGRCNGSATLKFSGKYAGEISLDITFYDTRKNKNQPILPRSKLYSGEKRSMETAFNSPQKLNFDMEDKQDPVKKTKKESRGMSSLLRPSDPEQKVAEAQRLHENINKLMLGIDPRFDEPPVSPTKNSRSSTSLPVSRGHQSRPLSPRSPTRTSELPSSKDTASSRGRSMRLDDGAIPDGQGSQTCSSRSSVHSQVSHRTKTAALLGSHPKGHHHDNGSAMTRGRSKDRGPEPMDLDDDEDDVSGNSHEADRSAMSKGHKARKPKKLQIQTDLLRSFNHNVRPSSRDNNGESTADIVPDSQLTSPSKSSKWSLFRTEASKQMRNLPFMNIDSAGHSKLSLFRDSGSSSARTASPERSRHARSATQNRQQPRGSYPPSPISPFTETGTWSAGSCGPQSASQSNLLLQGHSGSSPLPSIYEATSVPQTRHDDRRRSQPKAMVDGQNRESQSYVDKVRRARESFSSQHRRQSHLQFGQFSSSRNTTPQRPESDHSPFPSQRTPSPTRNRSNYSSLPTRLSDNAQPDDRPPADAATRQLQHAQDIMRQLRTAASSNNHLASSSTADLARENDEYKRTEPRQAPAQYSLPLKPPSIPSVQTMVGGGATGPSSIDAP